MNKTKNFLDAKFVDAVHSAGQLLPPSLSEVVFIGRSNVGKSSLLNALCNQKSLARVAKQPGRTQAIQFYQTSLLLESEVGEKEKLPLMLVDLPGFGYAQVSKAMRKEWEKLMLAYFSNLERISLAFLLIDSRREPRDEEQWVSQQLIGCPLQVVLTKADKVGQKELSAARKAVKSQLGISGGELAVVSTLNGERKGLDGLIATVSEVLS